MKLLYIRKQERGSFLKSRVKEFRDMYYLQFRVGFFLSSLKTVSSVHNISLDKLKKYNINRLKKFDAVIFNYECNFRENGHPFDTLQKGVTETKHLLSGIPIILFISSPSSKSMPGDEVLDNFELVFKREPFKDFDKYKIKEKNKDKIKPTVLSCPLVPANIFNYSSINPEKFGYETVSEVFDNDLFFLGQATSKKRIELIRFIEESDFNFFGGLHTNIREPDINLPNTIEIPRLSKKQFYKITRSSKINLALDGYGAFTYRHWEVWALCSFMISSQSVMDLLLPFEIEDEKHLVTFRNKNDLIEKTEYYLKNPEKRSEIARNGRNLFENEYDFRKHGNFLYESIERIL